LAAKSMPLTVSRCWFTNGVEMKPSCGSASGNAESGVPGVTVMPGMFTTPLFA
jgi:hypothetical protein